MVPDIDTFNNEGGVLRVIEAYHKHSVEFGIKYVGDGEEYDLLASHFGATGGNVDVAHLHGFVWGNNLSVDELSVNRDIAEACRNASEITVPSEWVAMTIKRDMRLSPHIVPHGIDVDDWTYSSKDESGGYVLWNKNRYDAVCNPTAVVKLAEAFPDHLFLTTFAPRNNLPNIKTIGLVNHNVMKPMIQNAGVYLSTVKETFGIGVLEAMASRLPVLGWDIGGNKDLVIHGETGYLARNGDYDDLREGLDYCLKYADILGENAFEAVKKYTWESVMEKVHDVYTSAMQRVGRGALC